MPKPNNSVARQADVGDLSAGDGGPDSIPISAPIQGNNTWAKIRMREADNLLAAGLLLQSEHAAARAEAADAKFQYRSVAWLERRGETTSKSRLHLLRRYLQLVYREVRPPSALSSDAAVRARFAAPAGSGMAYP